jgi:hypothetical protein
LYVCLLVSALERNKQSYFLPCGGCRIFNL